jgi:lathosterol oxidase
MYYFLTKTFWSDPWLVTAFLTTLLVVIFLRYAGSAYLYNRILKAFTKSSSNIYKTKGAQIRKEIKWSFLSSVVFTLFSGLTFWAYQNGLTKLYDSVSDYSVLYLCISPLLLLVLYETYYYWLHRLMHIPGIFRVVHRAHHESMRPTVFASFAFHPIEAVLQFLFFPLIVMIIPLHYMVIFGVLMLMTLSAIINHSGVEIFRKKILLKHLIGSSHHERHHMEFKTNFGLYFTWWDKWMKTESDVKDYITDQSPIRPGKRKSSMPGPGMIPTSHQTVKFEN